MMTQLSKLFRYYVAVVVMVSLIAIPGYAGAVLFSFDSLSNGSTSPAIDADMTITYGSNVDVSGAVAVTTNPIIGDDPYLVIENAFYDISISFLDVPITSVSFDWAIIGHDTVDGADFKAYADGDLFFTRVRSNDGSFGNSGLFTFSSPVTTLRFTDHGFFDIGVDNINVTSVPEPATLILLGFSMIVGIPLLRKNNKL